MRKNPIRQNGLSVAKDSNSTATPQSALHGFRLPISCIVVGIAVLYCSERSIASIFSPNVGSRGFTAIETLASSSFSSLWEAASGFFKGEDAERATLVTNSKGDLKAKPLSSPLSARSEAPPEPAAKPIGAFAQGERLSGSLPSTVAPHSSVSPQATAVLGGGHPDGVVNPSNTTNNYIGSTTGNLSTPGNWSLGHVPTVSEDAVFPSTAATGIRHLDASNLTVGSFNVLAATGTFTIRNETNNSTSTLKLGGAGNLGNAVSGNPTDLLFAASGSTFTFTGNNGTAAILNVVLGQSGNFNAAGSININAAISDGGSGFGVTKTGAGILTYGSTAANTYTGLTTVNAGELDLFKTATLNSIAGNLVVGDGVGAAGSAIVKLLTRDQIANTSDVTINSDGLLNTNGLAETIDALNSSSSTASITFGNANVALTIGANNEAAASYAGAISGTGLTGLTKIGTGTQTFSGTSTYTGVTTVSQGVLVTAGTNALSKGNYVDVKNGATLGIQVTNDSGNSTHNVYVAGQGVAGKAALYNVSGTNTFARQLNLDGTGGAVTIASASGSLTLSGRIQDDNGTPQLQFTGGTVVLTANNNTYAGGTLVNGGTLLVNNVNGSFLSGTSTGPVSVTGSGSVLGGTGYVGGPVSLSSAGILRGGTGSSATGALTLTNTVDTSAGIIQLALGAGTSHSSLVSGGGSWTFGATQSFNFIDLGATAGTTYSGIITGLSADPGTESSWTNQNGWMGTFSWDGTSGINFNLTAVPEPGTWAAGILTLLAVGWLRQKKISRNGCGATAGFPSGK